MNIHLIQGEFTQIDAVELITQMIQIKIQFHENKIKEMSFEEDIKLREVKIKRLQNELNELRNKLNSTGRKLRLESTIEIEMA